MDKREKDFWNHKLSEEEEREFLEHGQEGDKASEAYRSYISNTTGKTGLPKILKPPFMPVFSKPSRPEWLDWGMKIAAGVLLATALDMPGSRISRSRNKPAMAEDTYQDPRKPLKKPKNTAARIGQNE
jgi:hypothetical protein